MDANKVESDFDHFQFPGKNIFTLGKEKKKKKREDR